MHFLPVGECVDADMTFGVTNIPYTITAGFFNEALLESVLGVRVGFDGIRIDPHLPAAWQGARICNLTVGESVWDIEINGHGVVRRVIADGQDVRVLPLTKGRHHAEVRMDGQAGSGSLGFHC
jgi:cellobiose phosphorylase